jgi:sigma-B regulation protein RsbU (phosphoserine phosphatase)
VSRLIGSSLDLQTVLEQVMDAIVELTRAERGILMLLEDDQLNIRMARNFDRESLATDELTVSRTVTNRVLQNGRAILTTNAQEDPRFAGQPSIVADALSSIMASPLRVHDQIIGVIYVDNRALTGVFFEADLELLGMFGQQAAIAIDNAVQVQERENALKGQIEALKIEIDEVKKVRQVKEIVETEYFEMLRQRSEQMRKRSSSRRKGDTKPKA